MPQKFYYYQELSNCDFLEWLQLIQENIKIYDYTIHFLMEIVNLNDKITCNSIVPIA